MDNLPRHYLGARVCNGYLVALDGFEDATYKRFYEAASAGDEIAQACLATIPVTLTHEMLYIANTTGVRIAVSPSHSRIDLDLSHAHYPHSFRGKCLDRLQTCANAGNHSAVRLLAYLARMRFTDPDFKVIDRG